MEERKIENTYLSEGTSLLRRGALRTLPVILSNENASAARVESSCHKNTIHNLESLIIQEMLSWVFCIKDFHVILLLLTTIKDGAGDKYTDRPLVAAPAPGPARLQKKRRFSTKL
jgi:hypothetical protein